MLTKHFWKLFALLAVLLVGGAFVYANYAGNSANEGIVLEPHIKGNPDATVTLTEYSDFQCPACQQFTTVVADVLATYGDQVRFEYKHFPLVTLHPNAVIAGRAAEAAGQQGKFFEMHDKLFENQSTWSTSANPQVFFIEYAKELGLDEAKFKTHMRASALRDHVMAGFEEARGLGLTGTPTFFLNGEQMEFTTYQEFTDQVAFAVTGIDPSMVVGTSTDAAEGAAAGEEVNFGF